MVADTFYQKKLLQLELDSITEKSFTVQYHGITLPDL